MNHSSGFFAEPEFAAETDDLNHWQVTGRPLRETHKNSGNNNALAINGGHEQNAMRLQIMLTVSHDT